MRSSATVGCILIWASVGFSQTSVRSDPLAAALARQSFITVTSGISISDVVINANVISPQGEDIEAGTAIFRARGLGQSRVDVSLGSGNRSEVRALGGLGGWKGDDGTAANFAGQNCQTDAAWFFPALSSLSQAGNPNFVFNYVGDEDHLGVMSHHIRVYRTSMAADSALVEKLSAEDFFLDAQTGLPVAIAFKVHPDADLNVNLDSEIRFGNYQRVSGVMVPFSVKRVINGSVVLDATVTSVFLNPGTADSEFYVQ